MRRPLLAAGVLLALAGSPESAGAQLLAAKDGPVVYGHHHLFVTDVDAHRTFWIDGLGGTPATLGTNAAASFPNVIVLFREGAPAGGTKGSAVDHIGFAVPDVRAALGRLKAAGFPAVTRAEASPGLEIVDDVAYVANQGTSIAFVMAPDGVKVELVEVKGQAAPAAMHHVHYYTQRVDEMKAWYVRTFGARGGTRGSFQAADLPGVNLTFSPSPGAVAGTQGRVLDHVGFEVKDLEAFCRTLEAAGVAFDRPYAKVPALGIAVAFLTDPFGTYIELTEGLDAAMSR